MAELELAGAQKSVHRRYRTAAPNCSAPATATTSTSAAAGCFCRNRHRDFFFGRFFFDCGSPLPATLAGGDLGRIKSRRLFARLRRGLRIEK